MSYVVIESTPGFLPDADEPPEFDDLGEAREHAAELLAELSEEGYATDEEKALELPGDGSGITVYMDPEDLGRHVAIAPASEGAIA
jgi:hypothetical protein